MKAEEFKNQLFLNSDEIIKIILKGNTVEIKKNKDGISIFEVTRKKIKNFEKDLTK